MNDVTCDNTDVASGVIQGTISGPQLYSMFIPSIAACIHNTHYLFYANDLKLILSITFDVSKVALQVDLHWPGQCAITWGMSFNKIKCHVLHHRYINPTYFYSLGAHNLFVIDLLDDLGLLREAASPGNYDAHLNSTLRKAFGAIFLILHSISSRRFDILRIIVVP